MDKPSPMTLLDELTTPVQFRILKLLLPFFSFSQQRMLATWIKFSELQRTLELFSSRYTFSESPLKAHSLSASFSYEEILEVLAPYLTESERQMSENLKNMKEMLSMVQLFQDFSPDPGNWGFGNNSENEFENRFGNGFENESANEFKNKFRNESSDPPPPEPSFENTRDSPLSFLMNLLTPEQRNTFNTCNELFAHALTPSTASADISQPLNQKGDLTNGTMDEPSCNEINRPSQAGTDQTGSTPDPGQDRTQSRPGHAQSDHQCQ